MSSAERRLREMLQKIRDAATGAVRPGLVYAGPADFVLRHGRSYAPAPPRYRERGADKCCFGNAIMLAVKYPRLRYVEGFAVVPRIGIPVLHAWNVDDAGRMVDITWRPVGAAYIGVEFAVERADDATWNGDACVLDDWKRGWPLLREPWTGERSWADYEPSEPLALARVAARRGKLLNREVSR
jgi:hypothetical protein